MPTNKYHSIRSPSYLGKIVGGQLQITATVVRNARPIQNSRQDEYRV